MNKYKQVILLGIDGATWNVIDPLIQKGLLPNFRRLRSAGAVSKLQSTIPASSPPGWTSIATGVTPGKHHIFDFVKRKQNSYFIEPLFGTDRSAPAVWDYLGQYGKKTIALAIPFTYPPAPIDGILTCGLGAPSKNVDFAVPPSEKAYILSNYPDFDVDFEEQSFDPKDNKQQIINKIYRTTDSIIRLSKDYMQSRPWDLFFVVFRSLDPVKHLFWDDTDTISKFYRQLDEFMGFCLDKSGRDILVMAASDHGFQRVQTKFFLNDWLHQNGYLTLSPARPPLLDADKLERTLIKIGLKEVIWKLKRHPALEWLVRNLASSQRLSLLSRAVWDQTKLFYLGISGNGLIYGNIRGREPAGIVDSRDVYKLYKEVQAKLRQLKYRGQPVVKQVLFADSVYSRGPSGRRGPDILVTLNEGFVIADGLSQTGQVFEPKTEKFGDHHPDGIVGLFGAGITPKSKIIPNANVCDITPTVLSALGLPLSDFFDGKPLIAK